MMQISVVIRNVRRWAWWLALLCVAALVLAAQATRSVKGIVCDQNGIPIREAARFNRSSSRKSGNIAIKSNGYTPD